MRISLPCQWDLFTFWIEFSLSTGNLLLLHIQAWSYVNCLWRKNIRTPCVDVVKLNASHVWQESCASTAKMFLCYSYYSVQTSSGNSVRQKHISRDWRASVSGSFPSIIFIMWKASVSTSFSASSFIMWRASVLHHLECYLIPWQVCVYYATTENYSLIILHMEFLQCTSS